MTRRFAEDTAVPISHSREAIDRLLRNWGAQGIQWSDDFRADRVTLRFIWPRDGQSYLARMSIRLPTRAALEPRAIDGRTGQVSPRKLTQLLDQRGKREHRVLLLWLTAALNAVDAGLVTAEELFLPFLEDRDGSTFAEIALPRLPHLLTGSADLLLPAIGGTP